MKVIIIIVLILLGLRVLRKNIHFSVYSNLNRKVNDEMNRQREEAKRKEGQVTIDTSRSKLNNKKDNDGEYVDYTEVK